MGWARSAVIGAGAAVLAACAPLPPAVPAALILSTPFGPFSIPRTGTSTVTLSDTNDLSLGEGEQLYSFTFLFGSGPRDPTIVNTPDPI